MYYRNVTGRNNTYYVWQDCTQEPHQLLLQDFIQRVTGVACWQDTPERFLEILLGRWSKTQSKLFAVWPSGDKLKFLVLEFCAKLCADQCEAYPNFANELHVVFTSPYADYFRLRSCCQTRSVKRTSLWQHTFFQSTMLMCEWASINVYFICIFDKYCVRIGVKIG